MPQYQGVWNLQDAARLQSQQQWVTDPNFKNTTLLLQADNAANSAQNNTFLDSSPNSFSITRNGNTTQGTFTPFSQGWSNYFDGSGDNIVTPSNSAFDPSGSNITVDCFVYLTRYPNANNIVFEVGASTAGDMQCNIINTGEVRFTVGGSTGSTISGFTLNTWHYITCVKSGTNFTVYLNGVAGTTVSLSVNSRTTMYIGSQSGGNNIDGYISNFRFVKGSANVPSGVPTSPLTNITNTSLLICQSNRFVDNSTANSGSGFALTVNGNVSVQPFAPFAPQFQYTQSGIGGSGYFDGNDFLSVPDDVAFTMGAGDFTLEAWVYVTAASGAQVVFGTCNAAGSQGSMSFLFYAQTGSGFPAIGVGYLGTMYYATSSEALTKNQWNHIAGVRNGATVSIYVNGVSRGTLNMSTFSITDSTEIVGIGRNGNFNGEYLTGYISSARIVKGTAVYTGNFTPPRAPLSASGAASASAYPSTTNVNTTFATSACSLLTQFTNAGIIDGTMDNVLETVGNAQVSTSVVKYGSGSMYFDGTGDYLTAPNAGGRFDFGLGDFTIEFWMYAPSGVLSFADTIISKGPAGTVDFTSWAIQGSGTGGNIDFMGPFSTIYATTTSTPWTSGWVHVAMCRAGSNTRCFVNGSQVGSTYTTLQNFEPGNPLIVGSGYYDPANRSYNGYLDDVRITKGFARYISNFTPPQVALPRQ